MHYLPIFVFINRSVFERIGVFDPDLPICEDYDFWLRLLLTYEIGLVDEPLVLKTGGHADQLSTSTWGLARFHLKSLEKILRTKNINPHRREQVLRTIAYKAELLTKGFIKHEKILKPKYREKNLALEQLSQLDSISCFMNFIVALQPEARPLIDRYKLVKRNDTTSFPIFENENHRLIISGMAG